MHQIWYTKYTTWRMGDVDSVSVYTKYTLCIIGDIWSYVWTKFSTPSIRPVPGVWLTYNEVYDLYRMYGWRIQRIRRVHQVCSMYHRWYMVLCMHQIWYTKYTTCTWLMANVQWSTTCTGRMADVHSIKSVYTKYTICIIGDIWSNVCTKFGTRSIRPGVWLTYTASSR